MIFFPVKAKDGKRAAINLTVIFAFIDLGATTIAVSTNGATFEIPTKYDDLMVEMDDFLDGESDVEAN